MNKEAVVGKWSNVLSSLNITVPDSPTKHGACPICGKGKNGHRFRFDDKEGRGTWICTQCGNGDGWSLIMQSLGVEFKDAVRMVESVLGIHLGYERKDGSDFEKKRQYLRNLYRSSKRITKGDIVYNYLDSRKISISGIEDLRFCPSCYCTEISRYIPAMLGIMKAKDGKCVAIHRTYIYDGKLETRKKMSPAIGTLAGCAIRLGNPSNGVIGISEGIETALSYTKLFGIPVWASTGNKMLEAFIPPEGIKRVVVCSDNDVNYQGQASAYRLASKLFLKNYDVKVMIPESKDWNDELIREENEK